MSKKGKGVAFNSRVFNGVDMYEDAKAKLKHETLMQDYQDLQNEADVMRGKLEAAKQRKLTLAAEVRFLRRRYKYLSETHAISSSQEQNLVQARVSVKQTTNVKKSNIGKQIASPITNRPRKKILQVGKEIPKGRIHIKRPQILDLNLNGRTNGAKDAALRNSITGFDLNEASLPSRAPIFDLNEISTGDEDFQSNVEGLVRGVNDEQQNDLKLSICRNSGEGPSRVGKRKISWQDPVALRV